MSTGDHSFFQQLVARQQGHADIVQPLIPSRFAPTASSQRASEPFSWTHATPQQEDAAEGLPTNPLATAPSASQQTLPFPQRLQNSQQSSSTTTLGTPISLPSQPSSTVEAAVVQDAAARLAEMTRWMTRRQIAGNKASGSFQSEAQRSVIQSVVQQSGKQQSTGALPSAQETRSTVDPVGETGDRTQSVPPQPNHTPTVASQPAVPMATTPSEPVIRPSQVATHSVAPASNIESLPSAANVPANNSSPRLPTSLQPMLQALPLPPAPVPPAPTIQIAIGRIEIRATAPTATTTPTRRRTLPKPAMSLDRYLQQRSRRS